MACPSSGCLATATSAASGQWIESVNQTLKGQLGLEHHGGRTPAGVFTRVAQRLLAMAAAIWHNWTTGVTSKRSLTAHDHQHQLHGINHLVDVAANFWGIDGGV